MKNFFSRFRRSVTYYITGVFLLLLLATTVGVVLALRYYVQRDLQEGTRNVLVNAMGRLESELFQLQSELSLFAQLSARSAVIRQTQDPGGATLQITLIEQSRPRGIEIHNYIWGSDEIMFAGMLDRGFAGIPTVDYITQGGGAGRLHLVAVAPAAPVGAERSVATASISLGREFLRQKRASLGGEVTIVTKGEVIASSSTCLECLECLRNILYEPGRWSILEAGKSVYFTFDCRPEPQAAIATPVRTFDGKTVALVILRSRADEEKAIFHATIGVTAGSMAFSLCMGAAFFLLTSRVLRPLTELTRLSAGISDGRYGETLPVKGEGEVAELAVAFNRMSVSLKQAMQEISDWNRLLETRVEEKTQELEKIHLQMIEIEKLASMGQLAAGVAHELNNPLSGIMGYSEIALELFRDKPPDKVTAQDVAKMIAYFGHIEGLTQRCRGIILDMLKFARQHTEEFKEVQLSEVVRQTLVFLEKQLGRAKVKVVRDLPEDIPFLKGNDLQLQQVFTNLILNAAQAMPGGGTLEVRTRRNGGMLEAEFTDSGTGIEPEHLHRVFEPFFTTKPVGEGTGLGLSVSYGIIKHHGGDIRVSSEPGKGSTFTVFLPLHASA
ncbi:MAG: ATP-binding protein [Candidatus Deferrimicrobiota bacterium]|mgnify:CR=1 FL=1